MRIVPGAGVVGVALGSAIAQTTAVVFWWVVAGPWYFAWDYRVILQIGLRSPHRQV